MLAAKLKAIVQGFFAVVLPLASVAAGAETIPAGTRAVDASAFIGISGDYTGLAGGRNASFTAGLTASHGVHKLLPGIEVRGRYALAAGQIVKQRQIEGGLRLKKPFRICSPYLDLLAGRGDALYLGGGHPVPSQGVIYLETAGMVISPGLGAEITISPRFAFVVDGQLERWDLPYRPDGKIGKGAMYSKVGTLGLVYRFGR